MNEWELARYLIDSKKCIDSLMYIENNFEPLSNLDLKSIIDSKLRLYYIDLCIIFDYSFNKTELKNKLLYCFKVCQNSLPKEITLDYVTYDKNLFRYVNMITPEIENKLNELLYNKKIK